MTITAVPNKNEETAGVEMIDLKIGKEVWATVHVDFFLQVDKNLYKRLRDRLPVEITIQAAKVK